MKISSNMTALGIVANMNKANNKATTAMQRLSSGLKINTASDDPAGWAIATRLDAQAKGLGQANQNSMDAISFVQTAEGALNEVHSMLNRMKELSVQGVNGSLSDEDKQKIQYELDELVKEIKNTQKHTSFNALNMLDSEQNTTIQIGANGYETMAISGKDINLNQVIDIVDGFGLNKSYPSAKVEITAKKADGSSITFEGKGDTEVSVYKTTVENRDMVTGNIQLEGLSNGDVALLNQIKNAGGLGEVTITMKDKNGNVMKDSKGNPITYTGEIELEGSGTNIRVDFNAKSSEEGLLTKIDRAIEMTSTIRGRLGAYQNRLEHTVANLGVSEENVTDSLSRIEDADMAEEMTNYTLHNVISQSGIAMLAQANQRPQQVLQLLNS